MIVLTDCPPKIRGDLTKWLCEINTGVYVGKISARVRDELWDRICTHLAQGRASMVYTANNEQGMEFRVHHTTWEPMDFDGLTLMRRPIPGKMARKPGERSELSKAAQYQKARRIQSAKQKRAAEEGYVVVDLETTGLSPQTDEIIEIGAVHVVSGKIVDRLSLLVRTDKPIPVSVQKLTGITQELLTEQGIERKEAINRFLNFVGERRLVYHNAGFDTAFLQRAYEASNLSSPDNPYVDTMVLAKRNIDDVQDYRLQTLARYFGWAEKQVHRAVEDCEMTWFIYEKLKEIE